VKIQDWRIASPSTQCVFANLHISHGEVIFPIVRCVNNVELSSTAVHDGLVISYKSPDSTDAGVHIIPNNRFAWMSPKALDICQGNHSTLKLHWEGFNDLSGIQHYECRVLQDQSPLMDWRDVGKRTGVEWDDLHLLDGLAYTVQVRAGNSGRMYSAPVNASIRIDGTQPILTGMPHRFNIYI
jgi:hypothetical protein